MRPFDPSADLARPGRQARPGAADLIEAEVREAIARDGLGEGTLERAISDAIWEYKHRSVAGGVPPLRDEQGLAADVLRRMAGLGPLTGLLEDGAVEEIWINEPGRVFIARRGEHELTETVLTGPQVEEVVERMLAVTGRRVDRSSPFVDARLADGSRLHVVVPPVAAGWCVNIRKFCGMRHHSIDELIAQGSLTSVAGRFLAEAVRASLNIVIAGAVGAGKTSLLNCLAAAIPPSERVVTCEEVFELQLANRDVAAMQCRPPSIEGDGEIDLRALVRESLRMRPDRIIIGEVRGAESLDMLLAMNAGCAGMTSIHANSAKDALRKLATLPLLAGENVSRSFVEPTVAACVDLVVYCTRNRRTGARRVDEILGIAEQVAAEGVSASPIFTSNGDGGGELHWTGEYPRAASRFAEIGSDLGALLSEADAVRVQSGCASTLMTGGVR